MTLSKVLYYVFGVVFCLFIQIVFLRNLVFLNYAFCFLYIGSLLVLPPDLDKTLYLLIAFVVGIVLDTFMNTLGLHAAASVIVAYLRSFWIDRHVRQTGEELVELSLRKIGFSDFLLLFFPLVFVHSAALFMIEAGSTNLIVHTLARVVASSLFTMVGVLIWQSFLRE